MAQIAYFVHGRGRGHATRALRVLPKLRGLGHQTRLYAGATAAEVLANEPELRVIDACMPGTTRKIFLKRLIHDLGTLNRTRPELVICDGDAPSAHAAPLMGIPSLAIGHGLVFGHTHLPQWLPRHALWHQRLLAASSSWLAKNRIAVHFSPLQARTEGTQIARPELDTHVPAATNGDHFILAYFRDANFEPLLDQISQLGLPVICYSKHKTPSNIQHHYPNAKHFAHHLSKCRFVVASAGSQLLAECALLRKPMLALWKKGDSEQRLNALLMEEAGIGIGCQFDGVNAHHFERMLRFEPSNDEIGIWNMPSISDAVIEGVNTILTA